MSTPIFILILVISSAVGCLHKPRKIFNSDVILKTGEACVSVQNNGLNAYGLCTPIQDCPSILIKRLFARHSDYTVCRNEDDLQIVCCPKDQCRVANSDETGILKLMSECSDLKCSDEMGSRIVCCPVTQGSAEVFYVASGDKVNSGEYTHMAALGYKINFEVEWKSGGSLISDRYVLTAAHCLTDRSFGSVQKVRLGVINLLQDDSTRDCPEDFDVANLIPHPDYNPKFVYNDIGLIELASQVKINYHIRPICLPFNADIPQKYKSMGWGATGYAEDSSVTLLKIDQELFSYKECQNQYNVGRRYPKGILNDTHICAGSRNSIQSTCQGDSGGPLLSQDDEKLIYIYGIVSFGSACGFVNSPGVYTKVFPYIEWIIETIYSDIPDNEQFNWYSCIAKPENPLPKYCPKLVKPIKTF